MYLIDGETKCKCSLYALQEKCQMKILERNHFPAIYTPVIPFLKSSSI